MARILYSLLLILATLACAAAVAAGQADGPQLSDADIAKRLAGKWASPSQVGKARPTNESVTEYKKDGTFESVTTILAGDKTVKQTYRVKFTNKDKEL